MKRAVLALEGSEAADEDDTAWVGSESGLFRATFGGVSDDSFGSLLIR